MKKLVHLMMVLLAVVLSQEETHCSPVDGFNSPVKSFIIEPTRKAEKDFNHYQWSEDLKYKNEENSLIIKEKGNSSVNSQVWTLLEQQWYSRYIPYKNTLYAGLRKFVRPALDILEEFTCLHFVEDSSEPNRIRMAQDASTCETDVGYKLGEQLVNLNSGCVENGVIIHEVMHTLGRYHEHERADRDKYVNIKKNCIPDANIKKNFKKLVKNFKGHDVVYTRKIPYDYLSLMHYPRDAFVKKKCKESIIPAKRIKHEVRMGQKDRMTMYDALQINIQYCPELMVRLVGGKTINEGRIEVFWNGQWGTVCGNSFDIKDAQVFCSYMGFPGVDKDSDNKGVYTTTQTKFGRGYGPVWFNDMKCKGNEETPFDCPNPSTEEITRQNSKKCNHDNDASVVCKKNIRLVNKKSDKKKEGRVEIYGKTGWGTICSPNFDMKEANVICRQLGYKEAKKALKDATKFGKDLTIKVWENVVCTGEEEQIIHCRASQGKSACLKPDAPNVGVICQ